MKILGIETSCDETAAAVWLENHLIRVRRTIDVFRKVTEAHGKGKDLLLIENVPMVSCPNCGESYFTAETLHEVERIKLHRKTFALERPVPMASFV